MEPIILVGGGGHCKSCIDVIEAEGSFKIVGIIDVPAKIGGEILGYPVMGTDDDLPFLTNQYKYFLLTIGQIGAPDIRIALGKKLKEFHVETPVIISPFAYVSRHAKIGEGTIVMHHALVNTNTVIGENCIINSKSLIEHDVTIGNNVHIATGAIINGGVTIGSNSFVGSGAVCKQSISIPENAFIKANSIVK